MEDRDCLPELKMASDMGDLMAKLHGMSIEDQDRVINALIGQEDF